MMNRIIGTLACDPVFASTKGTSAKMQVLLRTKSGSEFRATGFVTSPWTGFHAGDNVDVYFRVKQFQGKTIRVITDIVRAGAPSRRYMDPVMHGKLKFNPEYKSTNGPSIMMRVVLQSPRSKDRIAHGFIETPWNAFREGDMVELDYSIRTFGPNAITMNCVEDLRAHVMPKAEPAITTEPGHARVFTVAETQVRNHYRTLRDGRKIFVRGHTRRYAAAPIPA